MRGISRGEIDWPAIERDYCMGLDAVRELARRYGVTETMIRRKAKAERWVRMGFEPAEVPPPDPEKSLQRVLDLADRMLDELEATTAKRNQMRALILEAGAGDESAQREAALKAMSLPRRTVMLKTVAQAIETAKRAAPGATGKKAERQAAAEKVAGRFGMGTAPKLAVDNTRK
jgi:hypothetical protein